MVLQELYFRKIYAYKHKKIKKYVHTDNIKKKL
jgi:hypothetical protein